MRQMSKGINIALPYTAVHIVTYCSSPDSVLSDFSNQQQPVKTQKLELTVTVLTRVGVPGARVVKKLSKVGWEPQLQT